MFELVSGRADTRTTDESAEHLRDRFGRLLLTSSSLTLTDEFVGDQRFLIALSTYRGQFDVLLEMDLRRSSDLYSRP